MSKVVYKAELEVNRYSVQGWDSDTKITIITLESDSIESLNIKVDSYIKDNTSTGKGDRGIVLNETKVKVIRKYKSVEEEIKEPEYINLRRYTELILSTDLEEIIRIRFYLIKNKITMDQFGSDVVGWVNLIGDTKYRYNYNYFKNLLEGYWNVGAGYTIEYLPADRTTLHIYNISRD